MTDFEEDVNLFAENPEITIKTKALEILKDSVVGVATTLFSFFGFVILLLISLYFSNILENTKFIDCGSKCSFQLVETIPHQVDLQSPPNVNATFEIFHKMILEAKSSIKISAFYWSLANNATEGFFFTLTFF
jgi:hypothetical protein